MLDFGQTLLAEILGGLIGAAIGAALGYLAGIKLATSQARHDLNERRIALLRVLLAELDEIPGLPPTVDLTKLAFHGTTRLVSLETLIASAELIPENLRLPLVRLTSELHQYNDWIATSNEMQVSRNEEGRRQLWEHTVEAVQKLRAAEAAARPLVSRELDR